MTITDMRVIEFDEKALIAVIAGSSRRAEGIGLPALRPSRIGFSPDDHRIRVEYQTRPVISVPAERFGALLVAYCVRARIPIPRGANKELRIEANSVSLVFNTVFLDPGTW
jgi:hypothetical protein